MTNYEKTISVIANIINKNDSIIVKKFVLESSCYLLCSAHNTSYNQVQNDIIKATEELEQKKNVTIKPIL